MSADVKAGAATDGLPANEAATGESATSESATRIAPAVTWRDALIGTGLALATVAIWSAWPVITRHGVTTTLDPMAIGVLRFLPPVVILAPLWWRLGLLPRMRPAVLAGLLCGGFPFFIGATAGFQFATVANAVPVSAGLTPVVVAVLSLILFKVPARGVRLAGLGLISASILLTVVLGLMQPGWQVPIGHFLFAISGISFALYTIAFPFSGLTGLQAVAVTGVWSLLIVLPFGISGVIEAVRQGLWGEITLQLLQQGVLSSIMSFVLFNAAVRRIGPSRASTFVALAPAGATLVAYLVLGEVPSPPLMAAVVLITIGVALASRVPPAKA